jgi:hypothetical protein
MTHNLLPHMRGIAPVSPDPKMHFNQLQNGNGGNGIVNGSWFESEKLRRDFRNLKSHDLASPMFIPGIIKESPRPS